MLEASMTLVEVTEVTETLLEAFVSGKRCSQLQ